MSHGMNDPRVKEQPEEPKYLRAARRAFLRRPPPFLDTIINRSEYHHLQKRIGPYIKKGQVVADIGCGWGYFTFVFAGLVGIKGKVYSVDLSNNCIGSIQKKADKTGYHNIEAVASTAADLGFIEDKSVDFVFANGLLCSMENDRESAVREIQRILKPGGSIYLSLGGKPPLGLVDEAEWKDILKGFHVKGGGSFGELWALVSLK